jgi:transposase InsO family protein
MKPQLHNRLCAPLIQDVMARFYNKKLRTSHACEIIGVSTSRLYTLRTEYLQAKAEGTLHDWQPGNSGGDHIPKLPPKADAYLRQMLNERYNFAFASSELSRRFNIEYARWSVRRFALAEGFAQMERPVPIPAHTRRWQRLHIGELWQLDASPHPWFGPEHPAQPLFDMIDDASRLQVGIRLCGSETVAQYIYFFEKTFGIYGLPLEIYVDNATFFRSPVEGNLTGLGWRLAFYGVSLRFAGTPQAKGKVERIHQVWQDRLPGFFRLNGLGWESDLAHVNETLEALATHRNTSEKHRELGTTPRAAWDALRARG